jgi:putative alpha-1,2-mannosidase
MISISPLILFFALALAKVHARQSNGTDVDVLDRIDPLIGSRNGGNVFAGATLPYGMAKGTSFTTFPYYIP